MKPVSCSIILISAAMTLAVGGEPPRMPPLGWPKPFPPDDGIIRMGFHHRGPQHPVGPLKASSIGPDDVQNPTFTGRKSGGVRHDATELIRDRLHGLSVNPTSLGTYALPLSRPGIALKVHEWRDVRGELMVVFEFFDNTLEFAKDATKAVAAVASKQGRTAVKQVTGYGFEVKPLHPGGNAGAHIVLGFTPLRAVIESQQPSVVDGTTQIPVTIRESPAPGTGNPPRVTSFTMWDPVSEPAGRETANFARTPIRLIQQSPLLYHIDNARWYNAQDATARSCPVQNGADWILRGVFTLGGDQYRGHTFRADDGRQSIIDFLDVGAYNVTSWHSGFSTIRLVERGSGWHVDFGNFARDIKGIPTNTLPVTSQYYAKVWEEERAHQRQFEGAAGNAHPIASQLYMTSKVIAAVSAAAPYASEEAAEEAVRTQIRIELERSIAIGRNQASEIRCALEREVKSQLNMPQPFNMSCAYRQCP